MSSKSEMRFLPTLSQVQEAADMLPDPETFRKDTFEVSPEAWKQKYSLTFSKIKFRSRTGKRIHRWTYEGKVLVRNKAEQSPGRAGYLPE